MMELTQPELTALYLYEMGSYDLRDEPVVPPTITMDATSIKCGIPKIDLYNLVKNNRNLFQKKVTDVEARRKGSECIFLTSKGMQEAKRVLTLIKSEREEFIDEDSMRKNLSIDNITKQLKAFEIELTYTDIYLTAKRNGVINLQEFIEPRNWKDNLLSDHAYPEMVILSNTSCNPFGGVFTAFGEPGLILPINKRIEIGVHYYGKGSVIRWMKRSEDDLRDAYHIEGKKGFQSLVSGHSQMMKKYEKVKDTGLFKDQKDFLSYFEVLSNYDYSIIFSGGTGHGISLAGHAGTILAAIAVRMKDGMEFPLNGIRDTPLYPKLREKEKIPVWDFPEPVDIITINGMLDQRHSSNKEREKVAFLLRKFIVLSQIFEEHWNSSFKANDLERIKEFKKSFDLRGFSSGGACISSIFSAPALVSLTDKGGVDMESPLFPDVASNQNIGLVIDRKGDIDIPRKEFISTFRRVSSLVEKNKEEVLKYFNNLKRTSGNLAVLSSKVFLHNHAFADPEAKKDREAISNLIMMQKGIYSSLGIRNNNFEELLNSIVNEEINMNIGPIGVGNSGTYFFCIPDNESIHSFKNLIDRMNIGRAQGEKLEMVIHGSSHSYIFNIDPLMVIKK